MDRQQRQQQQQQRQQATGAPAIGSTVRVTSKISIGPKPGKRPGGGGGETILISRRSIVATAPDEEGRVSLVQDDLAPSPLKRSMGKFLVAPMFTSAGVKVQECEVPSSDVQPLLAFERDDHVDDMAASDVLSLVEKYKAMGDEVFKLNDFTSAVSYYEAALGPISSKYNSVGSSLVIRRKGHSVIAEVDCIEDEEQGKTQYDVTLVTGDEATITEKDILLSIWTKDTSFLQPRILLNMARCLLKLADIDPTRGNASCVGERLSAAKSSRQEKYRAAAVLGCSIAFTLCEYHAMEIPADSDIATELGSLVEKARLVRSRAFLGMRKYPNATLDAKRVLARNASHREAEKLLSDIKAAQAFEKSMDKKLSKEVCRWVQTASSSSKGAEAMNRADDSVSQNREEGCGRAEEVEGMKSKFRSRIDGWKILRNVSMEIVGLVAFLVAMSVINRKSHEIAL